MRILATFLLLLTATGDAAEPFPRVECETLSNHTIVLPESVACSPALIIMGFTHESQKQLEEWGKRAQVELGPGTFYTAVVLEAAPRLVRGMITRGIKGNTPKDRYDRSVLIFQHEKELKAVSAFGPGRTRTFYYWSATARSSGSPMGSQRILRWRS